MLKLFLCSLVVLFQVCSAVVMAVWCSIAWLLQVIFCCGYGEEVFYSIGDPGYVNLEVIVFFNIVAPYCLLQS